MTLQEAITHLERDLLSKEWCGSLECKQEHEDLLAFLLELKEYRAVDKDKNDLLIRYLGCAIETIVTLLNSFAFNGKFYRSSEGEPRLWNVYRFISAYNKRATCKDVSQLDFQFSSMPDSLIAEHLAVMIEELSKAIAFYHKYEKLGGDKFIQNAFKAFYKVVAHCNAEKGASGDIKA